jgi:acyl carrier protein
MEVEPEMDKQEMRLAHCFMEVFPELTLDEISQASATSVQSWDSVSTITLLTVVEEEFEVSVEAEDVAKFNSFKGVLNYLQQAGQARQSSNELDPV